MSSPTPHQLERLNVVLNTTEPTFGLYGSAGVGKTYGLAYLVDKWHKGGATIYIVAPTHKALQVLKGKVNYYDECFKTLHSFLGYKMYYYEEHAFFKPVREYIPPYCDKLIIDEASMVNLEMVGALESWQQETGAQIVIVGDKKQLPPIGEEESILLDYPGVTLEEIVRQKKGSKIIDLSRNLDLLLERKDTEHYQFLNSIDYDCLVQANGTDECKLIAWRNFQVDNTASKVRDLLYGPRKETYQKDEWLYFTNPIKNFHNNQEVQVKNSEKFDYEIGEVKIETYNLTFHGHKESIITPSKKGIRNYKKYTSTLLAQCKAKQRHWREYYDWIESWAFLKYNYSVTVHRSQGSTYETSLINLGDILCNPKDIEREKMLYTAITRASDNIQFIFQREAISSQIAKVNRELRKKKTSELSKELKRLETLL